MNEKYFEILINECKKTKNNKEVPVYALITKDNKVVAKAKNGRIHSNNPLLHAEIKCILKASKKEKDWRLDNYDLYTTLEPCHMCQEIIKECRIRNVYYLVDSKKDKNYKTKFNKIETKFSKEYRGLLTDFFKKLR